MRNSPHLCFINRKELNCSMVKKDTLRSVPSLEDHFRTIVMIASKYVTSEPVAGPLMVIKSN